MKRMLVGSVVVLAACTGAGTRAPQTIEGTPATPGSVTETPRPTPDALRRRQRDRRAAVWVAVEAARQLVRVDVAGGRTTRRIEVPGSPHNITVARDGTVIAALWDTDAIAIVRGGKLRIVSLGGAPHDVKVAGSKVVVANQGAGRLDFLTLRGELLWRIPLEDTPHDIAVAPGGRRVLGTMEGSDALFAVGTDKPGSPRYFGTGREPHDLLFSPAGDLWVTDWNGPLHVASQWSRRPALRSVGLGAEAHHLAFDARGRGWITDHETNRVYVVSRDGGRVVDSLAVGGAPHHVAVTRDGRFAVVADHDGGRVLVYDAVTRRRVRSIAVGAQPHGVWADQ